MWLKYFDAIYLDEHISICPLFYLGHRVPPFHQHLSSSQSRDTFKISHEMLVHLLSTGQQGSDTRDQLNSQYEYVYTGTNIHW